MTDTERHKTQHKISHEHLNYLVADYIAHIGKQLTKTTLLEFVEWSCSQTLDPSEIERRLYCKDCTYLRVIDTVYNCIAPDNLADSWYGPKGDAHPNSRNQCNKCRAFIYRIQTGVLAEARACAAGHAETGE